VCGGQRDTRYQQRFMPRLHGSHDQNIHLKRRR
jgi:hypothetical protein